VRQPTAPASRVSTLVVSERGRRLVNEVLDTGQLAQGPMVAALEQAFAEVTGVEHCVAVTNGTVALQASLVALGIGPGDEVITSPLSFIATANAIIATGATVRFADVGPDLTVDPTSVEALVGPSTAAVLPVHLYGLPADLHALQAITRRHGLALVEDAAQAHGARVGDRRVGSFGVGCFSLYGTKNVAAGEGGLVTTSDSDLAERLRVLRNQGMGASRYDYRLVGWNWRMTDLHAAVALPQVEVLDEINTVRAAHAAVLLDGLHGTPGLTLPAQPSGRQSVWHQFTVRIEAAVMAGGGRAALAQALASRGVASAVYYPDALPDVPPLRAHPLVVQDEVPKARAAALDVLSLPVGHHLDAAQLDQVVACVREALG